LHQKEYNEDQSSELGIRASSNETAYSADHIPCTMVISRHSVGKVHEIEMRVKKKLKK
jgi:hypothetical protein